MKKILLALFINATFALTTQGQTLQSYLTPWKSNGFIYWSKEDGVNYKVNVYQLVNSSYTLISSTRSTNNYFQFTSPQLTSSDLFYTIGKYSSTDVLLEESDPQSIGDHPGPVPICYLDCNGLRESYRINLMQTYNGSTYLMASDNAGAHNALIGQYAPYYQAIDIVNYELYDVLHPYRKATAGFGSLIYERDHIEIFPTTPGGPYYDAQNNIVTTGFLVEKKMDKYEHFNTANTGNYEASTDWCEANIGTGTSIFNANLDPASLPTSGNTVTGNQAWFLTQTGTDSQGNPIYQIPNQLYCSTMQNGSGSSGGPGAPNIDDFMEAIELCFDFATGDVSGDPEDCLIPDGPIGGGLGGLIGGITFESLDKESGYYLSIDNPNGTPSVKGEEGDFSAGLYRINLFLTDGRIIPVYRVLGPIADARVVEISISPNVIVNSELKFGVQSNENTSVNILVQKLDGTTVYTEAVNLIANTEILRVIPITGDIPYNQLRVSVILDDGTVIQETALTE
ncbi:hypothetical protein [Fluviicola chungangensis]|uniref:Uncharacterized protein n=1 Tax=Fluviicola chungangensis TaxID=2597671 RepID=A0A556N7H1_9FLAO|nr:hypothetical protein [Fluviicola chungangensis]TSJ48126.1 hypothetical protein FO442_03045 [Fluviicola chungangensis]